MKIKNGVLLSVDESDLVSGVFHNTEVIELSDNCFYNMRSLIKVSLPNCKKIGNDCLRYNASMTTASLPVLTTMGNYCLSYNASMTTASLPVLTTMGNYCLSYNASMTTASLPVLTTMGNDCLRYNDKMTTASLPVLTTMGNDCLSYNASMTTASLPVLTTMGNYCLSYNASMTTLKIGKKEFNVKNIDGYCYVIESEKTSKGIKLYSGYNLQSVNKGVIEKQESYVAEKEGFTAHGETVKKAIGDLQFKMVAEKLKKEPIKKDTMISVNYYRLITGSCELGCKDWVTKNGLSDKEEIRADELLPILEKSNAYGIQKFRQLINWA